MDNNYGIVTSRSKPRLAVFWLVALTTFNLVATLRAQPYIPGQSYFGRSNYIEYIAGNLPVIITEPHGGSLFPAEIPDRTYGTFATDSNTEDLVRKMRTELQNLTGLVPHVIMCRIDRDKIDCNRDILEGAQGDPEAEQAWNEFHNFTGYAQTNIDATQPRGFYLDIHGHGHDIQRLELGYLLSSTQLGFSDATLNGSATYENQSSIRTLSQLSPLPFATVLRGSNSFGAMIVAEGYPAVPSPTDPNPGTNAYFNGGYNTDRYTSVNGGTMDGLQIESNFDGVRDSAANRTAYAKALARVLEQTFAVHYGINLRETAPKIWAIGSGSLGTAGNWFDGALPVSTNHVLFVGAGGTVTHNLAAFTTGIVASVTFSNGATGAYTLGGNALTVLRGLTNNSSVTQVINNNVTFLGTPTVVANNSALTLGGVVTNLSSSLRMIGNINANGVISGPGVLTKSGAGTLALTAINTYSGPTTNASGTITLNATATFGDGSGLLVLAGGDVLCKNTRSVAPIANPILLAGSSAIVGDGTLTNSLRILPFSANSITTTSGTLLIRNAGTNAFASNNVFRVRFTGGGFTFTRPLTVGLVGDLEAASTQLESYNDNLNGDQAFTGNISGVGQFRRDAASVTAAGRTILSGVNSYSGGTIVAAGTLLVNNPFGSGTGSGFVVVSNNGTLGGTGSIAGPVWCAGTISPGQSVGAFTFSGGLDLGAGGTNVWELSNLTTTGEGVNFDQVILTDGNLALGPNAKLRLSFINAASAPNANDPFWLISHTWKIVSLSGAATNSGNTAFGNIVNGSYATGSFTNYTDASGNIFLAYLAAPAPSPIVQAFALDAAGQFNLTFSAQANRTCVLQYTTDLSTPNWINVSTNIAPAGLLAVTNVTNGDAMRFYRIYVMP